MGEPAVDKRAMHVIWADMMDKCTLPRPGNFRGNGGRRNCAGIGSFVENKGTPEIVPEAKAVRPFWTYPLTKIAAEGLASCDGSPDRSSGECRRGLWQVVSLWDRTRPTVCLPFGVERQLRG